jgi:hypothetical protein
MDIMKRPSTLLLCAAASTFFQIATAPSAFADAILGTQLASFAVLGASTVTNTGATTLTGNLGASPGDAITDTIDITVNGTNAATAGNPSVHEADAFGVLAQSQLFSSLTNLGRLGPGALEPVDLAGLTLSPGVYTVPAGVSNLTGTLTLDGRGNANAFWVFQMASTLITSPGSVVNVINAGAGAGLYWDVRSSATLDTTTSFEGNILALTSIGLNTGATIGCGRALAHVGAVTMDTNTISTGCTGTGEVGSNGLSGSGLVFDTAGNVVDTTTGALVASPVPEPGTLVLLGSGIACFAARRRRSARGRQRDLAPKA